MATNNPLLKVPTETIAKIDDDLDKLEDLLEPILANPLSDTLEKLSLINRAKLCTLLPYVTNSLILIYLKTNGVDPKSHPVMNEMKRVKAYFEKISEAEKSKQSHAKLDTEVANRFIKSAITSANTFNKKASTSKSIGVIGNHLRFDVSGQVMTDKAAAKIEARAEIEKEESDSEEDEVELQVVGGTLDNQLASSPEEEGTSHDQASESMPVVEAEENTPSSLLRTKRKRPRIDPFAGYDIASSSGQLTPASMETEDSEAGNSGVSGNGKHKRRRRKKGKQAKSKLGDEEPDAGGES